MGCRLRQPPPPQRVGGDHAVLYRIPPTPRSRADAIALPVTLHYIPHTNATVTTYSTHGNNMNNCLLLGLWAILRHPLRCQGEISPLAAPAVP